LTAIERRLTEGEAAGCRQRPRNAPIYHPTVRRTPLRVLHHRTRGSHVCPTGTRLRVRPGDRWSGGERGVLRRQWRAPVHVGSTIWSGSASWRPPRRRPTRASSGDLPRARGSSGRARNRAHQPGSLSRRLTRGRRRASAPAGRRIIRGAQDRNCLTPGALGRRRSHHACQERPDGVR
jgi:hypothetical protein